MIKRLSFYIEKKIYYVNIVRTNNKNMYLKIKNKQIIVSVPKRTSAKEITFFVNQHIEKFVKHLDKNQTTKMLDLANQFVYIQGLKYWFKILTGFNRSSLEIKDNVIYFKGKLGDDNEIISTLNKYLKKLLINYLIIRIPYYEKLMNLKPHLVKVINKESNWASNAIGKQKLSFALKLIHYPSATIDYVIVHELAHDFEPNHSPNFWKIVNQFFPNYVIENQKLKHLD